MGATVSAANVGPFIFRPHPTTPVATEDPTFEPDYGFEGERKERVMLATEEAMKSAKIPLKYRDYCAHLLINYQACKRDKFPFVYRCKHEKHEWDICQYEDQIIRMKEYEREKRLLELKKDSGRKQSANVVLLKVASRFKIF